MKLRDDVAVVTGCALGLFDGSCTALYISLPHLLNTVIRVLWMTLLVIGGYMYLCNQIKESHETQVKARAVRQQKIHIPVGNILYDLIISVVSPRFIPAATMNAKIYI